MHEHGRGAVAAEELGDEPVAVAAVARSGPAASGSVASAASASADSGSFVTAIVNAPRSRARCTYSSTSGVSPDCDKPTTQDERRSTSAP